ncbi:hypothetical protein AVEN_171986-1, partial [Araneus ventricosus]
PAGPRENQAVGPGSLPSQGPDSSRSGLCWPSQSLCGSSHQMGWWHPDPSSPCGSLPESGSRAWPFQSGPLGFSARIQVCGT